MSDSNLEELLNSVLDDVKKSESEEARRQRCCSEFGFWNVNESIDKSSDENKAVEEGGWDIFRQGVASFLESGVDPHGGNGIDGVMASEQVSEGDMEELCQIMQQLLSNELQQDDGTEGTSEPLLASFMEMMKETVDDTVSVNSEKGAADDQSEEAMNMLGTLVNGLICREVLFNSFSVMATQFELFQKSQDFSQLEEQEKILVRKQHHIIQSICRHYLTELGLENGIRERFELSYVCAFDHKTKTLTYGNELVTDTTVLGGSNRRVEATPTALMDFNFELERMPEEAKSDILGLREATTEKVKDLLQRLDALGPIPDAILKSLQKIDPSVGAASDLYSSLAQKSAPDGTNPTGYEAKKQ